MTSVILATARHLYRVDLVQGNLHHFKCHTIVPWCCCSKGKQVFWTFDHPSLRFFPFSPLFFPTLFPALFSPFSPLHFSVSRDFSPASYSLHFVSCNSPYKMQRESESPNSHHLCPLLSSINRMLEHTPLPCISSGWRSNSPSPFNSTNSILTREKERGRSEDAGDRKQR